MSTEAGQFNDEVLRLSLYRSGGELARQLRGAERFRAVFEFGQNLFIVGAVAEVSVAVADKNVLLVWAVGGVVLTTLGIMSAVSNALDRKITLLKTASSKHVELKGLY